MRARNSSFFDAETLCAVRLRMATQEEEEERPR